MQDEAATFLDMYLMDHPEILAEEQLIASSPSFDLRLPRLPGNQDVQGIPNATPELLRRLQDRKIRNPGGQDLPGFLKSV
jgi:hypothetical protein